MSSILKALKRLEEEKARQKGAQVDLVQNILRGEQRTTRPPAWRLPMLVLALLLVGGLCGMLAVNWLAPGSGLREPAASVTPPPVSPVPEPSAVAGSTLAGPDSTPVAPLPAPAPAENRPQPSGVAQDDPVVAPRPAPDSPAQATAPAPEPAAPAAVPDEMQLVVSGIVYQDDPDGRIAVVNDQPVMQGNPVDGAVVEEILPDRVRFSRDGHSFEVLLEP